MMFPKNLNILATSAWSLESISLLPIIERAELLSSANEEDGASENLSNHSGGTLNSSGTNATSHLSGFRPENELVGAITGEVDAIRAASSRYNKTQLLCYCYFQVNIRVLMYCCIIHPFDKEMDNQVSRTLLLEIQMNPSRITKVTYILMPSLHYSFKLVDVKPKDQNE